MSGRALGAALAATAFAWLPGTPLLAQAAGEVDVGVSAVEYEGYLSSGAAFLNPTLRYDTPSLALGARGSYVLFESGSHILQGTAAGAWTAPMGGRWRGEISGAGGVTSYVTGDSGFPGYGYGLGRARVHYRAARAGGWVSAATGYSFFGDSGATPVEIAAGAWAVRHRLALGATATGTWLADTAYLDVVGSLRWVHPQFTVTGSAGFRAWSEGGGSGMYGEAALEVPLWKRLVFLVSGGRYPSDPVRGVVSATYVSAGMRITAFGSLPDARPSLDAYRQQLEFAGPRAANQPRFVLGGVAPGGYQLRIEATGAALVEITGDFTDWDPVPLSRIDGDTWAVRLPIAPGVHRLNVRIDGGEWTVPQGLRSEDDGYGGAVGILVIG